MNRHALKRSPLDEKAIRAAAERLANNKANRRGAPDIKNIFDLLPKHLQDEVLEDARDAVRVYLEARS